ncbi:hypothetical protein K432DRAFT_447189, partial [Lepidopterella palustris CBS 459.81]
MSRKMNNTFGFNFSRFNEPTVSAPEPAISAPEPVDEVQLSDGGDWGSWRFGVKKTKESSVVVFEEAPAAPELEPTPAPVIEDLWSPSISIPKDKKKKKKGIVTAVEVPLDPHQEPEIEWGAVTTIKKSKKGKKKASVKEAPPAEELLPESKVLEPYHAPSLDPEPIPESEPVVEPEPLLGDPSTESIPSTQSTIQRPKTSPYSSSLTTLYIGPNRREYYVPQDLLQYTGWINSGSNWGMRSIELPSVDEDTGHVLVHYLYTGTYQTLDNTGASTADEGGIEFKRAVLAYFAAITYELHSLQRLAMENIEHAGMGMNIFEIFDAIDQDFPKCPNKTGWFHDYLKEKAKATFKEDHTLFEDDALLDRVTNVNLSKILVKCVVELHTPMVSRILNDKSDSIQTAPEESVHSAKDGPSGEAPANEYPTDHAPPEESPAEEPLAEEPLAEEPLAEEPLAEEPTPEEPPPEEPLAEEPPPEEPAAEEPADDSLTYDLGPAPEFDYPEPDYLEPDHRPSSPVCEISYPE